MEKKQSLATIGNLTPVQVIMIIVLVVMSYFIGSLKTKVEYLQKSTGNNNQAQVANQGNPAGQPQQPLTADNVPKVTKEDWVKGDRNAQVALIEYSDLECPFCKQFHPTAQKVVDEYKGKVMWVFRHYPLAFHANAQKEAEAAECAGSLGSNDTFWKFIDRIYERTTATGTGFALDALAPLAKELGLNEAKFKECLDSGKMAEKVKTQMDGGTQAGVNGTPGNILLHIKSGKTMLIPGAVPFEQIKASIDQLLAS
jgi:protein-disulfide isomerase